MDLPSFIDGIFVGAIFVLTGLFLLVVAALRSPDSAGGEGR